MTSGLPRKKGEDSMNWKTVQSTARPLDQDTTSSKIVNYVRRNIHMVQVEDMDGQERTVYEYDELTVNKGSWAMYLQLEQAQADIDFLNMITEDL